MFQREFHFVRFDESARLPLFPSLGEFQTVLSRADKFDDPFLNELILTAPVQRLKDIGFLGAIDYVVVGNGRQNHRRRHNRFDHSLGVAQLASVYAGIRNLSLDESRLLSAAGLLHDIGHGPLSHTLEPVFKANFSIGHHAAGNDLLRSSKELKSVCAAYNVDLDAVAEMIEGESENAHGFLFGSPINLDTIEGITRSRVFVTSHHAPLPTRRIVELIAEAPSWPTDLLDQFWELKHFVYENFIHNRLGLIYDGLAQAYMVKHLDWFDKRDFSKNESQLRAKIPELFHLFAVGARSLVQLRSRLDVEMLDFVVKSPKRNFCVKSEFEINSPNDLSKRYVQSKTMRSTTLGALLDGELDAA